METTLFAVWSILIAFQASLLLSAEEPRCTPGFESDKLIYSVTRKHLRGGTALGKVGFTDCIDHTAFVFSTSDRHFIVKTDGVLMVKRPIVLHEGHRNFFIHFWDSQGRKLTIPVSVRTSQTDPEVPVLHFSKSDGGLRRRKRDWIIPDLYISENKRGQYPLKVSQIRSSEDAVKKIYYSITGPGTDQPPVGLFRVDRDTGNLYVTQPLDREQQARYMFLAHAVADGSKNAEDPREITVFVTDQNDNKPVFTQSTFMGKVSEASVKGFEVITVEATDADEPNNDNSDIRYRILNQEPQLPKPNMFEINPINGVIRVAETGLNREKWPQYTLTVQAADLQGEGLSGEATVNLQVTDINTRSLATTPPAGQSGTQALLPCHAAVTAASATDPQVSILHFPKSGGGLRRRKREWIIPFIEVSENKRGPYPQQISQIRSSEKKKIYYSITGPGADQPPVGLFTVDRDTGNLYVTQSLDREQQAEYRFQVHAVTEGSVKVEEPMDIKVTVTDQNDNRPVFSSSVFMGTVAEASIRGSEVVTIMAIDDDEPNNDYSDIRYRIVSQAPQQPSDNMFEINPVTGVIRLARTGLDREICHQYFLVVRAADMKGEGLVSEARVIVMVTDLNDNAPVFTQQSFAATVEEKKVGAHVITMSVTDGDQPHSSAWKAKFKIIDGDPEGLFTVKTGPNEQQGIISTAKELNFEHSSRHTLSVTVENEVPFVAPLPTATATVVVTVQEAPVLDPVKAGSTQDGHAVDTDVTTSARKTPCTYIIPELTVPENHRGPYPLRVSQVRSSEDKVKKIYYSITGPGADQPPVSLFFMDRDSGNLYVTQALDREKQAQYTLQAHAVAEGGAHDEYPIEITINVMDQNDNKPVFIQETFEGQVAETSAGSEVIKVEATDADEPNSDNSDIRYRIVSQEPQQPSANMFEINPVTGVIRLAGTGLARQRYPQYTLVVEAADLKGEGLRGEARVIIKVVESP